MNISTDGSRRSFLKVLSLLPAAAFLPVSGSEEVNSYRVQAATLDSSSIASKLKVFFEKYAAHDDLHGPDREVGIEVAVVDDFGRAVDEGYVYLVPPDVYLAKNGKIALGLMVASLRNGEAKFKSDFPIPVIRNGYRDATKPPFISYFDIFIVSHGKFSGVRMQLAQGLCESVYALKGSDFSLHSKTLSDLYFDSGTAGALNPGACLSPLQHNKVVSIKANVTLMS